MSYLRLAVKLAATLFVIGTLILILFYVTGSSTVAMVGYAFTVTCVVITWAFIAVVLFSFVRGRITMTESLKILGVILINIPIAILYIYLAVLLTGYARVTFKNTTGGELGVIKIHGCEEKEIPGMKPNESETVWIKIPADCQIDIDYEQRGERKLETVAGYLTQSGGVKAVYEIGSNRDIFE